MQDARGGRQTFAHNASGQLASHTDCSGKTTRFSYSQLGHLAARTDALRYVTRYDTDRLGRVKTVTHPDGTQEHPNTTPTAT